MIDRLVDYLRAAIPRLRSDGRCRPRWAAQLDMVRAYLGLMAARMPRLQWAWTCPPTCWRRRCPPLMLISLAENAIKHGVERKIGPAQVQVRAARDGDGRLACRWPTTARASSPAGPAAPAWAWPTSATGWHSCTRPWRN
jgi:LytS/YehU family sensor histidine kinase